MGKKVKVNVVEHGGHLYVGTPDSEWVVGGGGRVRQADLRGSDSAVFHDVEVEIPDPTLKGGETGKLFGHDVVAVKGPDGYCWRFVHDYDTVLPGDRSFNDVVRD